MATAPMAQAYAVLGLTPKASKDEVKEAFVKLCLRFHPDKCAADVKPTAEARFREIKTAYDAILKGQAGYAPPPPGSGPSSHYARAYYRAHYGVDPEGPVRCGGPYGGYATEMEFYRSMFRSTRNNPLTLILAGIAAIPVIAISVSVLNGNTGFIERFRNEGIHMFTQNRFKVNGRDTLSNPFSIRSTGNIEESYIYKHEKFRHLRQGGSKAAAPAAEAAAEAAPAVAPQ